MLILPFYKYCYKGRKNNPNTKLQFSRTNIYILLVHPNIYHEQFKSQEYSKNVALLIPNLKRGGSTSPFSF